MLNHRENKYLCQVNFKTSSIGDMLNIHENATRTIRIEGILLVKIYIFCSIFLYLTFRKRRVAIRLFTCTSLLLHLIQYRNNDPSLFP